jgi:hypothetical protein
MLRQGLLTGQPIHVNELSSGVYVLKVMDENGLLIATQSFVKK